MAELEPLEQFFQRKGAVELFCTIDKFGSRFKELREAVTVAKGTLSKRLNEACELGLVTKGYERDGDPIVEMWVMSERGLKIQEEMEIRGIPSFFEDYREAVEAFERERKAFQDFIKRGSDTQWERYADEPTDEVKDE